MASAWSVQALDMASQQKAFQDSVMNPKRPPTPNANCGSPASVEYPSLGSLGWDSCSTGAQREHESWGASLTQQGTLGLHCVDVSLQGHPRQGQVPVTQAINN